MNFINWIAKKTDTVSGGAKLFDELLSQRNIGGALSLMTDNRGKVNEALKVYDLGKHSILMRKDKAVFGKKNPETGYREFLRWEKKWKIPIPYAQYINEMALVFLYGRPLKWSQLSTGTDLAFEAFTYWMKRIRFDSKIRTAKRLAGAETQSAMLFHVYRNDEGKADLLLKILAASLGDDLYFRKDQFDRLTAFARGYSLSEESGRAVYHLDIYTKERIYLCKRVHFGWDVEEQPNPAGKIPVILFEQETEFAGVEAMIERREWMASRLSDVNDSFSDPTLVVIGDNISSLPGQEEDRKAIHIKPGENDSRVDVRYLTWDAASESRKLEGEYLDRQILGKSLTPDISQEQIKGLSNLSGKALKQLMILASIKAEMRKETHDEYASRIGSLVKAIIGNVLDVRMKAECETLDIGHEFQEPFGEDIEELINNLVRTHNAGGISDETFIEMNPLVKDAELEKSRIEKERARELENETRRARMDVFGTAG